MNFANLKDAYGVELDVLRRLFTPAYVNARLDRLADIHSYTEASWREYTKLIPGQRVGFLLVAEAPPWSPEGVPQYVLDPASRPRTLMKALRSAFRLSPVSGLGSGPALRQLADLGVLVVDSIPFALDYSAKRGGHAYQELVGLTVRSYLQAKLRGSRFDWASDLKIGFSLRSNAKAVLMSVPELDLGGGRHSLSEQMIAVNGANYPDGAKLREVFGLD